MTGPAPQAPPRATYRLQLDAAFGFAAARSVLGHLRQLGISHVYLSPVLQAARDSEHGYDTVDPTRVDEARGGERELRALLDEARRLGLGVVLDIVPNHVATTDDNRWWWDILARGRDSRFAGYFDIDWDRCGGRVLLPLLGEPLDDAVRNGAVQIVTAEDGTRRLRVHDRMLPLADPDPQGGDDLEAVLCAQHYELAYWRDALPRLNWRRFFDVTSLIGVRVELDEVFDAMHARVLAWYRDGLVQGLRVDHPDGLRDPPRYVRRLREECPEAWIVVEKILAADESLPPEWPVDGTTGYDFLAAALGLFVDPAAERPLSALCEEVTGSCPPFSRLRTDKQRLALRELFGGEVTRVGRLFAMASGLAADDADARAAVEDFAVALPIYRTYVPEHGRADARDRQWLDRALRLAAERRPPEAVELLRRLHALLGGEVAGGELGAELRARFQQLTGPAMAKGLEDTALYCDRRLVCLNDVGSDPDEFGTTRAVFHERCRLLHERWPQTMTTLSTHDTKRSADVRLRIATLSEDPARFADALRGWRRVLEPYRERVLAGAEHLLYQTLVGCWPADTERIVTYMCKAAREAKLRTSWLDPDPEYEAALVGFVRDALADERFTRSVSGFVRPVIHAAALHTLSLTLLHVTAVGVPDVYQGCESWRENLTDPDNRRPVDFDALHDALARVAALGPAAAARSDRGERKLWLLHRALTLRARRPEAFGASAAHLRLPLDGADERRAIAFHRGGEVAVVAPRFCLQGPPRELRVRLPAGTWRSAWDGTRVGEEPGAAELFRDFPVALLVRD